jgi:ABC-type protease/lipase transport system fused ATPase/permease subunit
MVLFLAICFMFHVMISVTALARALVLIVLTLLADRWSHQLVG